MGLTLPVLCGQLIVGGFDGTSLPSRYGRALAAGHRGGAILFRRNIPDDVVSVASLNQALRDASPADLPPLIGVDQEGGWVFRLGPPVLQVPAMRVLGKTNDVTFARRVGKALGSELAALGFTMNFAPVLDVDSNPANPIIGNRSFGRDAATVARLGIAFAQGLETGGVLSCGKHFPGHGDTSKDSHLERPIVAHDLARLNDVELAPFRAAAVAGMAAFMTAHVVYPALDGDTPATLSRAICTDLLRKQLGFKGILVSDDLEMGSIKGGMPVEEAAVAAVAAGCDVLLICVDEDLQDRAHEALIREAESSDAFRARCNEAARRALEARRRVPPRPQAPEALRSGFGPRSADVARLLAELQQEVN